MIRVDNINQICLNVTPNLTSVIVNFPKAGEMRFSIAKPACPCATGKKPIQGNNAWNPDGLDSAVLGPALFGDYLTPPLALASFLSFGA